MAQSNGSAGAQSQKYLSKHPRLPWDVLALLLLFFYYPITKLVLQRSKKGFGKLLEREIFASCVGVE